MIPIDSIEVPARFHAVCEHWHNGMDKLYAICSTGGLTLGNRRPADCDNTEKWYYTIWCELADDVDHACWVAEQGLNACDDGGDGARHDAEYPILCDFRAWVGGWVDALAESYGLEEWDW